MTRLVLAALLWAGALGLAGSKADAGSVKPIPKRPAASNHAVGYRNVDGYTWNGTYWTWPDGRLYNRTTYPAWDSYGRYYLGVQYVEYKAPAALPPPPAYQIPDYRDKAWRDKVIDILADRENYKQYKETLTAAGLLDGNPFLAGSGAATYYRSSYYNTSPTIYGNNAFSYADIWGDNSPALMFQSASQHAKLSQSQAEAAIGSVFALVDKDAGARQRIAEIKANSDAAIAFLNAMKTQSSHHEKVERRFGQEALPPQPAPRGKFDPILFEKMAVAQCGSCHLGDKVKGGFHLESMRDMPIAERRDRVWARLTHKDPAKRMPQGKDGGPGQPLTKIENDAWFQYLFTPPAELMPAAKD